MIYVTWTDVSWPLGLGLLCSQEWPLFLPCNSPDLGTSFSCPERISLHISEQGGCYWWYLGYSWGGEEGMDVIRSGCIPHTHAHTSNNFTISLGISSSTDLAWLCSEGSLSAPLPTPASSVVLLLGTLCSLLFSVSRAIWPYPGSSTQAHPNIFDWIHLIYRDGAFLKGHQSTLQTSKFPFPYWLPNALFFTNSVTVGKLFNLTEAKVTEKWRKWQDQWDCCEDEVQLCPQSTEQHLVFNWNIISAFWINNSLIFHKT